MCGGSNSVGEDLVSGLTQVVTGGLVNYDPTTGKWSEGVITKGFKDVTGATAAEEANEIAREQVNAERKARLKQEEETRARTARDQMAASRLAASNRKSGNSKSAANRGGGMSSQAVTNLGSDEQDFLGL